jgi:hypothetical protein
MVLGFKLRTSHLPGRLSITWATLPAPFFCWVFSRWGSHEKFAFLFFWQYWGLHSGPIPWATLSALFCDGFFFRNICLGWLWTVILLISASRVARNTGISHRLQLSENFLKGRSGAQLDYLIKCMCRLTAGFDSPGVWRQISEVACLSSHVYYSVGQRERDGIQTARFNWKVKEVNLGLYSM